MAGRSHLAALSSTVSLNAVETLSALLRSSTSDEDDGGREQEALMYATRDVVAKTDTQFQTTALAGALTRVVAAQQEQLDALKKEVKKLSAKPR